MIVPLARTVRPGLIVCALVLFVVAFAPAAHAQDDAFKKGIEARGDQRWAQVTAAMRDALQQNPKEDGHAVRSGGLLGFGQKTVEYFPRAYLGEALAKSGDCVAAVDAWAILEQQGTIRSHADSYKIVQQGYAECEKTGVLPPAKFDPLFARATQQVSEVTAQAGRVSGLGQANPEAWHPEMREQYDRANTDLTNARARLLAGRKTRTEGTLTAAVAAAERAKAVLVPLEASLSTAIAAQQKFSTQLHEVEQSVGAAEALDRTIDQRRSRLSPALIDAYREGHDAIGKARSRLESARGSLNTAALSEAASLAQDGSTRFARVMEDLNEVDKVARDRALADAVNGAQEAFSFIDGSLTTLDRLAAQKPGVMAPGRVAERQAIEQEVTQARRRFDAARKTQSMTGIAAAARLTTDARDRLSALIAAFGPLTLVDRGVQPALLEGARLYLAGDYDRALAALNPKEGFAADVPLRLHVHLFRAAALYALFERSRETDASLRTRAVAEVEECRKVSAAFQPDMRAFGPRFISFFQTVGAQ